MTHEELKLRWLAAQCADALMERVPGLPVIAVAIAFHLGYQGEVTGQPEAVRTFLQSIKEPRL